MKEQPQWRDARPNMKMVEHAILEDFGDITN
jgi:hypothetical protein